MRNEAYGQIIRDKLTFAKEVYWKLDMWTLASKGTT